MRNPHIHLARLVISLGDEGFQSLGKAFVSGLVRLDNLSGPLVEDHDVVVLVQDPGFDVLKLFLA